MTKDVQFSQNNQLGIITLTRASALNALTLPMIQAMQQQLLVWRSDHEIAAVIIQSDSEKAFCAGGDVRWLYDNGREHRAKAMQFFWHEYRLNHCIHHYPKPYIALLDGMTMGGGVGISLHGSHPIASERFKFAMPETSIGFFPDIGASYLLARCPGAVGTYLGLTGQRIGAQDAQACGLIKSIVPSQHFPDVVAALAKRDLSTQASKKVEQCVREFAQSPQHLSLESSINNQLDAINHCFAQESVENSCAELEKLQTDWGRAVGADLRAKSPLALKVTLELLRRAKTLSMADCLKLDYCLVQHFMANPDFYEGVRALLVDKDKSPRWQPAQLNQVTKAMVHDYFECEMTEFLV